MSIGAIVISLVALAVCGAAMWLAWRIVKFAAAQSDGVAPKPIANHNEQTEARPRRAAGTTRRAGIAIAALAMAVGLGGILFVVWHALGG